jgi:large subunit ribosomal protein L2
MALKHYKATTPSQRQLINIDRSELWKGDPFKALTKGKTKTGGRNNYGRITSFNRGGGHKQLYRTIDFKRRNLDMVATVERLEYDPNRTSFIALVKYADNQHAYIIAPQKLKVGDQVISALRTDIKVGNAMPIKNIPVGTIVHNVELKIGKGGQLARSAGAYAQIAGRDGSYVIVKLSSGELRLIHGDCFASIGAVSNPDHSNRTEKQDEAVGLENVHVYAVLQ